MTTDGPPLLDRDAAVMACDVTRVFGHGASATAALDGATLRVEQGDIVALVGPSGSGKTTLLNCIAALDQPTSGNITVLGVNVSALGYEEAVTWRRQHVAIAFQADGLLPHLTVTENLDIVLRARDVGRPDRRRHIDEAVEAVGLEAYPNHRPDELSGGQRQRVALARALAARPALMILDEPTAQLDLDTAMGVLDAIGSTAQAAGSTVLIATHDPAVIGFAQKSITLVDGRIEP